MKVESGLRFFRKCLKALNIQSARIPADKSSTANSQSKKDSAYQLTWITDYLAVGCAPMSYVEFEAIREQGIDAIVNLCAEFCDLHEIEEKSGFEVYYLPIPDENAPDMEDMEKALAWLDESIYLGKKILVHCRHGIGRTGTFVTSYLLRRGLGLKVASRKMKCASATPTNYCQWELLRKYGNKSGVLRIREPSLEARDVVDLSVYFADYNALVQRIDEDIDRANDTGSGITKCGLETDECCFHYVDLQLIEAIYLSNVMNRTLKSDLRTEVIRRAVEVCKKTKEIKARLVEKGYAPDKDKKELIESYAKENILCPLNIEKRCSLYEHRPIRCRLHAIARDAVDLDLIDNTLFDISQNVSFAFSGSSLEKKIRSFSLADTVSGRFIQEYFYYLASLAAS